MLKSISIHDQSVIEYIGYKEATTSDRSYFQYNPLKQPVSTKAICSSNNNRIDGIICYKTVTINKTKYIEIQFCRSDKADIALELIDKILASLSTAIQGVFVSKVATNDPILDKYTERQFKQYTSIQISKILDLAKSPSIGIVKFDKSSKSEYRSTMIKLLTEFDTQINKGINSAIGHRILPTDITAKSHQIRISYFIDTLIKDKWATYIFFTNDKPIGFVKGKIVDKFCIPDVYIPAKYLTTAYATFINDNKDLRYIGRVSVDPFTPLGKVIGYQLYKHVR